jgi:hypothetical protein
MESVGKSLAAGCKREETVQQVKVTLLCASISMVMCVKGGPTDAQVLYGVCSEKATLSVISHLHPVHEMYRLLSAA